MKRILMWLAVLLLAAAPVLAESEDWSFWDDFDMSAMEAEEAPSAAEQNEPEALTAREDFINRIVDLGYELYVKANGK